MPFFSIIIPTYNRAQIIGRLLDSILNQSFTDYELIIVDDGGSDNTEAVVLANAPQGRYYRIKNSGPSTARNFGASVALGEYLYFVDSDDVVLEDALSILYSAISVNGEPNLVCGEILRIDDFENFRIIKHVVKGNGNKVPFLAGSFAIKKFFFDKLGGYDEQLWHGENAELRLRINQLGIKHVIIHSPLFKYSFSPLGVSKNKFNKALSNLHIVNKHKEYFRKSPERFSKKLYRLGFVFMEIGQFERAQFMFKKSALIQFTHAKVWIRYLQMTYKVW